MISILVLEDNEHLREKLATTLRGWDFTTKVFTCASNSDAIELISCQTIDVALVDLDVADGYGTITIRHFKEVTPEKPAIVISANVDPERILAAISSGAIGYLHKSDSSIELIGSIKSALSGESPISPGIAAALFRRLQSSPRANKLAAIGSVLTNRELEIIQLVSKGLSNMEVADVLGISKNTVPSHVRNIYRKLQTNSRSEAVFEARSLGLID